MGETYETTGFTLIQVIDYSDNYLELGYEPNTKDVVYEYMDFVYSARCFQDIIQFIAGQRHDQPLTNGELPTQEQSQEHDQRRELYNGNHEPLQLWINPFL
jgi:hypothetical protein